MKTNSVEQKISPDGEENDLKKYDEMSPLELEHAKISLEEQLASADAHLKFVEVMFGKATRETVETPINPALQFGEVWRENCLDLDIHEVLSLDTSEVASYCERSLDIPSLIRDLGTAGRKQFCEYLGMGESTLSGWLKQERVPRMAKEAYVLLKTLVLLQNEVKRLNEDRQNNVVIVDHESKYQLIRFQPDCTGALIGTILARDIPDKGTARILAGSAKAFERSINFRDEFLQGGDGEAEEEKDMNLPKQFESAGVTFTTERTTPWDETIKQWQKSPEIPWGGGTPSMKQICYKLWADGKYLGVIVCGIKEDRASCFVLQLADSKYDSANKETWADALIDYLKRCQATKFLIANS